MTQSIIVTTKYSSYARFPYPVGKRKMINVLEYMRLFQEDLIIRRINNHMSNSYDNHQYISDALIYDIMFDYTPVRNNSHIPNKPLKDKILKRYQSIEVEVTVSIELFFHESLNLIKIKDPTFYEDLKSEKFIQGAFHSAVFRSIMDSNIDDLF